MKWKYISPSNQRLAKTSSICPKFISHSEFELLRIMTAQREYCEVRGCLVPSAIQWVGIKQSHSTSHVFLPALYPLPVRASSQLLTPPVLLTLPARCRSAGWRWAWANLPWLSWGEIICEIIGDLNSKMENNFFICVYTSHSSVPSL